jgi:hypothetical protein
MVERRLRVCPCRRERHARDHDEEKLAELHGLTISVDRW